MGKVILHMLSKVFLYCFVFIFLIPGINFSDSFAENKPNRIISLSPSLTEILFAINADQQVIAVDSYSNFPQNAPTTSLSAHEPNMEAIASLNPDLVVLSYDIGDLTSGLNTAGIATLLLKAPLEFDGIQQQIMILGESTGNSKEAGKLAIEMQNEMARLKLVREKKKPVRIYHEIDENYYSASSFSFIGSIYKMLNLINIADKADKARYGYPKLSPEFIIASNPELIVLPGKTENDLKKIMKRPGWKHIDAVKNDKFLRIDSDIASRWGPRVVDFAYSVVKFLEGQ